MTTLFGSTGAVTTNPYPAGQCTWSVWQYVWDHFHVDMPDMSGNADSWVNDAHQKGWTVSQNPTADTIAVWGDNMYPNGHVAFVTSVQLAAGSSTNPAQPNTNVTQSFTVHEGNFKKTAPYPPPAGTNGHDYEDDRTIQMGSKEANSVQGFIFLDKLGIQPGTGAQTQPGSATDPWSGITAALQQAETDVQQGVKKAEAVAQIAAGMGTMAVGSYALFQGMNGRSLVPNSLKAQARGNMRQGVRTAGRQTGQAARRVATYRPNEGPPVNVPTTPTAQQAANERLLEGGRRYRNVTARQLGARNRPATPVPERVTRAGRSRILAGGRPATASEAQQALRWRPAAPTTSRPSEPPF